MQEYPRTHSTDGPVPFLATVDNRLSDIKQVLYGISEKLNSSGFYPPPAPAANAAKEPTENNVRHAIDDNLNRIHETVLTIKEQIDRLT